MSFNVKNVIAIHSCKGGVGKSTVAVSLALTLASKGISVGICDLDICGPSLAELFSLNRDSVKWNQIQSNCHSSAGNNNNTRVDLKYSNETCDLKKENKNSMLLEPKEVEGIKIMSSEFLLPKNYTGYSAYRGPIMDQICYEMVYKTNWDGVEYLILDLPPGTSDVIISLVENIHISGSILITTPNILSTNDLIKGIKLFKDMEIPILSIVENMSYYICECCCTRRNIFGNSKVESICKEFQVEHFVKLPLMSWDQDETTYKLSSGSVASLFNLALISNYHNSKTVQESFNNLVEYLSLKCKYQPQMKKIEATCCYKAEESIAENGIDW
ncbi:ParA/MinD ATPase like family protein [Theileria parva strain Muguga]|uniref:ParA/MinD ATPase like family protein n=1 Tax=Theileria parva strain Muguga TaxID=333668 RepID=UPI001C61E0C9|nr:ParA/MinD ATPase like family protein [Theileria parva strain Muguga]EAN30689.2 ParA/MinD ATPase like family protein [Theileria parva strain Muguga]